MRRLESSIRFLNRDHNCGADGTQEGDDRAVVLWAGGGAGPFGDGVQGGGVEG